MRLSASPLNELPPVTKTLAALIFAGWLAELAFGARLNVSLGLVPYLVTKEFWLWQTVTYLSVHADFLHFFKARGCYLDDLSLVPVNGMTPKARKQALADGVPDPAKRMEKIRPAVIVVVLKKIERYVREALALARLEVPVYILPFPGQGHQAVYRQRLTRILKEHLLPGS